MSENKFFNVGVNIFNKDEVRAVLLKQKKVEVTCNFAEVQFKDGQFLEIRLAEGQTLTDLVSLEQLQPSGTL